MPRFPEEKRREWEERIRLQQDSGQNMSRWCRENQINYDSFLYWKKRFFPTTVERSTFLELIDSCKSTGLSIEYKGVKIAIDKHFDPMALIHCLNTLKSQF
jgi:hypothetical protein